MSDFFETRYGRGSILIMLCPGCQSMRTFQNVLVENRFENDYEVIQVRPVAVEACCTPEHG